MNAINSFNKQTSEIQSQDIINQIPFISINSNLSSEFLSDILSKNPFLINTLDEQGETFLSYAIKRNNKEIINLILSSPLLNLNYLDKNENTYLHLAVIHQNLEAVKLLIKKGVNINNKNKDGNTALHLAYYLNSFDIINLLVAYNADMNIKNNKGLIPEEIIPTNEIDKIAGFEVSMNLEVNDDELKFDKMYKTIETSQPNRIGQMNNNGLSIDKLFNKKIGKNFNNNRKRSIINNKRHKNSLFYNTGNGARKISNIAWNFNENDRFIRKESDNYPFYLEFTASNHEILNSPKSNDTRNNTSESNSDNNIIYNNIKKEDKKIENLVNKNNNNKKNKLLLDFLLQINLPKYYDILDNNGFSNILEIIEETKKGHYIKDIQLKKIGIEKPGDRIKILIRLEEKANLFEFSIPKAVYYISNINYTNDNFELIEKEPNLFNLFLWLKDINLEMYFFNFLNNGYFSIDLLFIQMLSKNPLTEQILKNELLVEKLGYRLRILNKIKEEYPSYLNKLNNTNIIYNRNEDNRICSGCPLF